MNRPDVDYVPVGSYLLVFIQPEESKRPEVSLSFNIRDKLTVYELADMYFQELRRLQGFPEQDVRVRSVVLSKQKMKWSE